MRTHARPPRSRLVAAVVIIAAFVLSACSPRDDDAASASASTGASLSPLQADPNSELGLPALIGLEPIVKPETLVLDAGDSPVRAFTLLNGERCAPIEGRVPCEFSVTFSDLPDGLEVGSVLASDVTPEVPNGMLVKVTSIDGNKALATEATLADALEQGEFVMERQFTAADVRTMDLAPGVTAIGTTALADGSLGSQGAGVPLPIAPFAPRVLDEAASLAQANPSGLAFEYTIDHKELADGVYADGYVAFDVGCGAYAGLTWETVWGVPVYPNGVAFEAKCGVTQDAQITVTAEQSATIEKSVEIVSINLSPITFFVGPVPIVLVPSVTVYATASGKVTANMTFGATEHFGAVAGIGYNDGIRLIKDFSFEFDSTSSNVETRLTARAGVQVTEGLMLYGVAGPQLTQDIYAELQAKPPGERPIWCIVGGIDAGVQLHIDLGIKELNFGPESLYSDTTELGCASNIAPTIRMATSATSYTVYPTSTFQPPAVTAYADDVEEGPRSITWTEGSQVLGTTQSGAPMVFSMLSFGTHTITATTSDSDGATASTTITVEAKDSTPTIQIQIKNGSGTWVDAPSLSGTTGGQAVVRVASYSPLGISVGDCIATTWSGSLPVANESGCEHRISFTSAGSFVLTASATDADGKKVTDTISVTVAAPAVGSPPAFTPIAATNLSVTPNISLCDGCVASWGEQIKVQSTYTNAAQAGKSVRYVWEVRKAYTGNAGTWVTIAGTDASPTTGSSRTWTAPTEYKNAYTFTFRVTVYDNSTNAVYFTDTHVLTYFGPPA